jgi:hypothetical protein
MGQKVSAGISGARRVSLKGPVPLEHVKLKSTSSARRPEPPLESPMPSGGGAAIDLPCLARAVRRSVGHDGMRKEDAEAIASHILNFFGFNERIIDNVLEPDDRDTFYMLEDCGILETERDETTLYDGREWRIHYWMFRKDRILQLAQEEADSASHEEEPEIVAPLPVIAPLIPPVPGVETNVYHQLSDEVWGKKREGTGEEDEAIPHAALGSPRGPRAPAPSA